MKLTKIIAAISAAAVLMLTGCSSGTADNGSADASNGSFAAIQYAKEDIKVGVIHIGNPADGSGYSYTHDVGIQDMQAAIGLTDDQIVRKNNVSDGDPTATETAIRECIEAG